MNWTHDDAAEPPFLAEPGDDSPPESQRIAELTDLVVEKILEVHRNGGRITPLQARDMIRSGMWYGWQLARKEASVDQTLNNRRAVAKRRDAANAKHKEFRAAWKAAVAAGREVSVEQLARELGMSRATAYRAIHGG